MRTSMRWWIGLVSLLLASCGGGGGGGGGGGDAPPPALDVSASLTAPASVAAGRLL